MDLMNLQKLSGLLSALHLYGPFGESRQIRFSPSVYGNSTKQNAALQNYALLSMITRALAYDHRLSCL